MSIENDKSSKLILINVISKWHGKDIKLMQTIYIKKGV